MDDKITVPLAHKLRKKDARLLGASQVRDYMPDEEIEVPRRSAEMLFAAALLQGHPRSAEDRQRLLGASGPARKPGSPLGKTAPDAPVPPATVPAPSPAVAHVPARP